MKQFRIFLCLVTDRNDYQSEQAEAALTAARANNVSVEIAYAGNDAINQSQQLLDAIHSKNRPDAIVVQPVGTPLPHVARAAVSAGLGWALLNGNADYVSQLGRTGNVPVCAVTSDQEEIGRIHARQLAALVPQGGSVLYIQGPSTSTEASVRSAGIAQHKPSNIQLRTIRAQWSEESAVAAINSWLRLSTSHQTRIDAVFCQNDTLAMGARKAFELLPNTDERKHWLSIPYVGCDACPKTGREWIRKGLLTASVHLPPTAGVAVELIVKALRSQSAAPEVTVLPPQSVPSMEELARASKSAFGVRG